MISYCGIRARAASRTLAGFVLVLTLGFLGSAHMALAQQNEISSGPSDPPSSNFTSTILQPCTTYSNDACMIVAAFKTSKAPYWYCCGSNGNNGIGNLAIFFYVNSVYDATYQTNSNSSPGAITVLGVLGTKYTFQGTQAQGSCTNQAYYQQGWTVSESLADGYIYTLGIPYSGCS